MHARRVAPWVAERIPIVARVQFGGSAETHRSGLIFVPQSAERAGEGSIRGHFLHKRAESALHYWTSLRDPEAQILPLVLLSFFVRIAA